MWPVCKTYPKWWKIKCVGSEIRFGYSYVGWGQWNIADNEMTARTLPSGYKLANVTSSHTTKTTANIDIYLHYLRVHTNTHYSGITHTHKHTHTLTHTYTLLQQNVVIPRTYKKRLSGSLIFPQRKIIFSFFGNKTTRWIEKARWHIRPT